MFLVLIQFLFSFMFSIEPFIGGDGELEKKGGLGFLGFWSERFVVWMSWKAVSRWWCHNALCSIVINNSAVLACAWWKARKRAKALAKVKAEVNDPRSQRVTQDAGRVTEPESRNVFSGLVRFFFFFNFWFSILGCLARISGGKIRSEGNKKEKYVKKIMMGDRRTNTSILILVELKRWLGH